MLRDSFSQEYNLYIYLFVSFFATKKPIDFEKQPCITTILVLHDFHIYTYH